MAGTYSEHLFPSSLMAHGKGKLLKARQIKPFATILTLCSPVYFTSNILISQPGGPGRRETRGSWSSYRRRVNFTKLMVPLLPACSSIDGCANQYWLWKIYSISINFHQFCSIADGAGGWLLCGTYIHSIWVEKRHPSHIEGAVRNLWNPLVICSFFSFSVSVLYVRRG